MLLLATVAEKKKEAGTKFDSADFLQEPASLSEKGDKKTKPPASKKKKSQNPTGNAAEPAAKRPRVASKRAAISTEEPTADNGILNN